MSERLLLFRQITTMKNKLNKRSLSQKQNIPRRSQNTNTRRMSISTVNTRTASPNRVHFGAGAFDLDNHWPCLKPSHGLKNQKQLKRDLLRCSNQRPSLLGPQTLQPPRLHQGSISNRPNALHSSSSYDQDRFSRQHSFSSHSNSFQGTIDRVGPWPDVSIIRVRSDGNDLLRPLKSFRNTKNPRVFSPKYYSSLAENNGRFKFQPSTKTYIDEYRRQKGYLLNNRQAMVNYAAPSVSSSLQQIHSDDDQLSGVGTFSGIAGDSTMTDRTDFVSSDRSVIRSNDRWRPSHESDLIKSVSNMSTGPNPVFPPMQQRTVHPRAATRSLIPTQQAINLPTLTATSLSYLSSMNSVGKIYGDPKKASRDNPSKLYILDGRSKQR